MGSVLLKTQATGKSYETTENVVDGAVTDNERREAPDVVNKNTESE